MRDRRSPAETLLALVQIEAELGDELRKHVPDGVTRYTGQPILLYVIELGRDLDILRNYDMFKTWRDDFFKRVREERKRDRLS